MKNKNPKNQNLPSSTSNKQNTHQKMIEVLCQKMGSRWFAFSLIDDEVFVGSIQSDDLDRAATEDDHPQRNKNAVFKVKGNS